MSREARRWVWEDAPVEDARQLLILLSLADVASEHGTNAFPSKWRLSHDARCSERTVQRHLIDLVSQGLIAVEQRATQHRPTTYLFPALQGRQDVLPDPVRGDTGETNGESSPLIGIGSKPIAVDPVIENLCNLLADLIQEFNVDHCRPTIIDKWYTDMDLLVRRGPAGIDNPPENWSAQRVERGIRRIFTDLATPNGSTNFCWAGVIESPYGLRKKWIKVGNALKGMKVLIDDGYGNLSEDYDNDNG